MRGTRSLRIASSGRRVHHPRIIPAHAGNSCMTRCKQPRKARIADHPRACGELRPHRVARPVRDRFGRIIPAHAGNSYAFVAGLVERAGSSPRMRGTPDRQGSQVPPERRVRIIPAHAGNSLTLSILGSSARRIIPAHAGNSRTNAGDRGGVVGSSPRMRGTPTP